ncbi:unnamed protein product, partial [Prorocentrum cordatum]
APSRSSPIICLDLNDGMEMVVTENGKSTEYLDSPALCKPGHHLVATAMQMADDTWYGNADNSSLVDYVCIPEALARWETSCGTLARLGRPIQQMPSKQRRDHLPVHVNLSMPTISELRKHDATPTWSAEAMMQAYMGTDIGTKRAFVGDMEATLDQNWDEFLDLADRTSADFLIEKLEQIMINAGQQYFARDPGWDERYKDQTVECRRHRCTIGTNGAVNGNHRAPSQQYLKNDYGGLRFETFDGWS